MNSDGANSDGAKLRATAFRGDLDRADLHSFFLPKHQFDGDMLWTFGTSLKSAYVNTFEFMNHAPVVQLWRDEAEAIQAVSRISLGTGDWFHQAAPAFRGTEFVEPIVEQADTAFELLTDRSHWATVRYESRAAEIDQLEQAGYRRDGIAEVYMARSLDGSLDSVPDVPGIELRLLDRADPELVHERAMAQIDAFSGGEPTADERAWVTRSLPHQLSYGEPGEEPHVIAVDASGAVLAFADVFLDRVNRVGEFEPVGTRKSARRTGLSKAVLLRGLQEMAAQGMDRAVVRTSFDNAAAIAAYGSVGFEVRDHLVRFRKDIVKT